MGQNRELEIDPCKYAQQIFDKGTETTEWKESLQQIEPEQLESRRQKNEPDFTHT